MAYEFKLKKQVEFADTDMAGIVHFSNFFRYMEAVEHAFYRSFGCSVHFHDGDRDIGWPRVQVNCQYKAPLKFDDVVEIHLIVKDKKEKSITYSFIFNKIEDDEFIEVARGTLTVVCVSFQHPGENMVAIPIPKHFDENIQVAPDQRIPKE